MTPVMIQSNKPWNLDKTSGGSSGGKSVAIAVGPSPLDLDTNFIISIENIASQSGIMTLKVIHGRLPMTGI
jgi:aspartyl-tRNA(Asn)/glutamyl-tRNA(Gln) amidotransferase subunit A